MRSHHALYGLNSLFLVIEEAPGELGTIGEVMTTASPVELVAPFTRLIFVTPTDRQSRQRYINTELYTVYLYMIKIKSLKFIHGPVAMYLL